MEKKTLINSTIAGVLAVGLSAGASQALAQANDKVQMEKCYGVAKAGKNDCGSKHTKHSCAGQAKEDGHPGDWIYVLKGNCNKIVDGSLKPKPKNSK